MHGLPGDSSSPADWPAPGVPRPEDEPTIEMPVVTEATRAARPATTPTLAQAALSLALAVPRPRAENTGPTAPSAAGETDPAAPGTVEDPAAAASWAVEDEGAAAAPGSGGGPVPIAAEPGRRWLIGAGVAAAALLLTGAAVLTLSGDRGHTADWSPPPAAAPADGHTATAARDGRTVASLDLVDSARRITVRAADLDDVLYRITTPQSGAVVPIADERDGRVRLRLDGHAEEVDVTLNAAVRWDLRVAGGADLSTIDLSAGRVGGVELAGGASRIDLTLPQPDGTLNVRMSGGVSLFDVRTADRVPGRVRVGGGAGQVTLGGRSHPGVAAGRTFTPASWAAAVDRVDVDATAGMSVLTVASY